MKNNYPYEDPIDLTEIRDLIEQLILLLHSDVEVEDKDLWLDQLEEYNYVGEWGLAYEAICQTIYRYFVPINGRIYELIEEIGRKMRRFSTDVWEPLKPLVK